MSSTEGIESLERGFRIDDKRPERDYFVVTCRHCGARWSLSIREEKVSGGNILHLLNHEAGHDE